MGISNFTKQALKFYPDTTKALLQHLELEKYTMDIGDGRPINSKT